MRMVSKAEAAAAVQPGHRVYLHGGASTPRLLLDALMDRAAELRGVEIVHMHTEAPAPYASAAMRGRFRHNALFIGSNVRSAVQQGDADYTPVFLSEIPSLFAPGGALPLDVALVQVTPPDASGHCSLGVSVDCAVAAVRHARTVVAQVNPSLPRTNGTIVRADDIDLACEADMALPAHAPPAPSAEALAIGRHVAGLVDDGATLQLGIGAIPDAVLVALRGHRDLGIHSEMFSDGVLRLVEAGVITGARKSMHRGVIVASFVVGSQALYRFVDRNPSVALLPVDYTNDVDVIARQSKMVAINSAISVDLTGQVAADSIGHRLYSGIGGQVDFIRGAARSHGGLPIIALPATAAGGTLSRICAALPPGAGVVTTRGDVHWVVTEYGAADLHGRTIRERARMLIDLAHPDFRADLEEEAGRLGYLGRLAG